MHRISATPPRKVVSSAQPRCDMRRRYLKPAPLLYRCKLIGQPTVPFLATMLVSTHVMTAHTTHKLPAPL
jgi:hypothetical protein